MVFQGSVVATKLVVACSCFASEAFNRLLKHSFRSFQSLLTLSFPLTLN